MPRKGHHPPPPPPHHHHHPGHRSRGHAHASSLIDRIRELKRMGAREADLHSVIDSYLAEMQSRSSAVEIVCADPGPGTPDAPITALERAGVLSNNQNELQSTWRAGLISKRVLVSGEFPPHVLDEMLASGINVTQIHSPTEHGDLPPHFDHLAAHGLRGVTTLQEIASTDFDVLLVHGAFVPGNNSDGGRLLVAPIVPITMRMLPNAERQVLESDHIAPHMIVSISAEGFRFVSLVT